MKRQKQIKSKNQRLRLSLSIMVLSLCTVFLFLSNSANAQTYYQRVDYILGEHSANDSAANSLTSFTLSITPNVLYSYFYETTSGHNHASDAEIKAIAVYNVPNGTEAHAKVTLVRTGTGTDSYFSITSIAELRALSAFTMDDTLMYYKVTHSDESIDTSLCHWNRYELSNTYGKTFKLMNDLTFTDADIIYQAGDSNFVGASNFLPIGGFVREGYRSNSDYSYQVTETDNTTSTVLVINERKFAGTFDGQNYTISGLKILKNMDVTNKVTAFSALFGNCIATTLKNINLTNSVIYGRYYSAGICGGADAGCLIDNCSVKSTTIYGGRDIGGIAGLNSASTIQYCNINNLNISDNNTYTANTRVGGIVGSNEISGDNGANIKFCKSEESTIQGDIYVGGICGLSFGSSTSSCYSTIENCSTRNGIIIGRSRNIGGIIGLSQNHSKIENSYVKSTRITNDCSSTGTTDYGYTGGICGQNSSNSEMNDCYVISSIVQGLKGYCYGGICGINYLSSKINNCFVTESTIKGTTSANNIEHVGGIIGQNRNDMSQITNCYVTSTSVSGKNTPIGGVCGYNLTSAVLTNCYSTATVMQGTTQKYNCVGYTDNATVTNCYYLLSSDASEVTGYGTGLTEATMKGSEFITTLGNTIYEAAPTSTYYTYNDGYPILTAVQKNGSNYLYETMIATPKSTMINGDVITISSTTVVPTSPIILNDGQQLINTTSSDVEAFVKKILYVGKWNLIGSEISSNTFNTLNNNIGISTSNIHGMAATAYDYTTNNWGANAGNYLYAKDEMNVGEGYFVYPLTTALDGTTDLSADATTTLNQYGTLNNDATTQITKTTAVANGWVSLANPYPANISAATTSTIGLFSHDNSANMQSNVIYTFVPSSNSWVSNITGSTGQITVIKPGEGFVVASNATIGEKTYTITKPTSSVSKSAKANNSLIKFTSQANNTVKEAFATMNDEADNNFDQRDAFVMISTNNEDLVEPYFLVNDKQILKDEFKTMPYYAPMNFHASKVSNTNLTVSNIPNNVNVSIIDLSNGNETALENGSTFNFVANQGENEGRFVVKFAKNSVGIENNAEENNISLAMYPNPATTSTTLFIDGLTNDAQVSVCDVQGRSINNYTLNTKQSTLKINTSNLASGIYYIRVVSNNLTKTEKLIVK